jgi:hypothetical protein
VTFREPSVAVAKTVMFAVNCVEELSTHELTVIPAPKPQVAPLVKLLPVSVTLMVCPWRPELGLEAVSIGAG